MLQDYEQIEDKILVNNDRNSSHTQEHNLGAVLTSISSIRHE
jgi:hypothetical protein